MGEYNPIADFENGNVIISGVDNFDPKQTFDCGQAFRWKELRENRWSGVIGGRIINVEKKNGKIVLEDVSLDEYEAFWRSYLDIDRDYSEIISAISDNEILKKAAEQNSGIRILRQDRWETLCSFIISQNNNIPRIKGIIERLCESFGDDIGGAYSFPSAERIAVLTAEELAPIRCGFRARYIIDGAQKFLNGEVDQNIVLTSDIDTAKAELMKITGVGTKVADCTLLFGFGRIDALPKDVWIKRAIETFFNGSFPKSAIPYAGIAQQYLFNYIRNL